MTAALDETRILTIGAIALGGNVACLLVLLARPSGRLSSALIRRLARGCRVALAEAVGTFGLVFAAALAAGGPALAGGDAAAPPLLGVALAQGLVMAGLLAALAPTGAGHCNPAVTLGLFLAGRCPLLSSLGRGAAQVSGALAAGCLLAWLFGQAALAALPQPAPALSPKTVFLLEATGTFLLTFVFAATTADPRSRPNAPFAVGLTLGGLTLALGPLTGAALNPARYLALALPAFDLRQGLIYLAGPLCGGGVAAVFVQLFLVPVRPQPAQTAAAAVGSSEDERRAA